MIIGLCGKKQSGKDTFADIAKQKGYTALSFSKLLKDICSLGFGIPRNMFDDNNLKEKELAVPLRLTKQKFILMSKRIPVNFDFKWDSNYEDTSLTSIREILQFIGTDVYRSQFPSVWLDSITNLIEPNKNYIISDVRFKNELNFINSLNGVSFYIKRPTNKVDLHTSENDITDKDCTFVIDNDSTLNDYKNKVNIVLEELNNERGEVSSGRK